VALFVEATRAFQRDPKLAETFVRESLFRGQLSPQDYRDAMTNASFSYDITSDHVATLTGAMQKFGVGRMSKPPRVEDFVKLDLLARAKSALRIE
jgi:NitT/TauT family transport system substrate-binding protein